MTKAPKIDLTLLKQLVGELEAILATADGIQQESPSKNNDYVIEMSKAVGLASGAALEATMLVSDIQTLVRVSTGPAPKEDGLKGLLNLLKGGRESDDGTN